MFIDMNTFRQFVILGSCICWMSLSTSCGIVHRLFSSSKAAGISPITPATSSSAPGKVQASSSSGSLYALDAATLYNTLQQHLLQFHTYAARLKVNFIRGNESQNLVVNLRMQSDSLIWMNATALLGIEVARALITPDSITLINRLKRTYYQKSFQEISAWLGVPVDFHILQNLLVGNPPFLSTAISDVEEDTASVRFTMHADSLESRLWLTLPAFRWQQSELMIPHGILSLADTGLTQAVVQYFYADSTQAFPAGWQLQAGDQQHTTLQVEIQNVVLNQPLSFPFAIPAHYTAQ